MTNYAGLTIQGAERFDDLGQSVSSAGDVNGDGIDDFIVGAPEADYFGSEAPRFDGAAYVVFGTEEGPATLDVSSLDGSDGFRITGAGALGGLNNDVNGSYYSIGQFVTGVGDINGDGIDDIAVAGETATYYYDGQYARPNFIYVIFGKDTSADGDFAASIAAGDIDGANGFQVQGVTGIVNNIENAGDVNGDGLGDLLISQSPLPAFNYGYYGYYVASVAAAQADPEGEDEGAVLSGDGAVSAALADPAGAYQGYVLFGAADLGAAGAVDVTDFDGQNGFAVLTERSDISGGFYGEGGFYGFESGEISAIGDVNGDGFGDIAVHNKVVSREFVSGYDSNGYYYNDFTTTVESSTFIIFGQDADAAAFDVAVDVNSSSQRVQEVFWAPVSGTSVYDGRFFYSYDNTVIRGIGDVNGDGFDDVAVGDGNRTFLDPNDSSQDAIGIVSVYFGGSEGVDLDSGGDANNDGVEDGLPIVGSQTLGSPNNPDLLIFKSDGDFNLFGSVIAGVGDVNGDGIDDFAISGPREGYYFGQPQLVLDDGTYGSSDSAFLIFGSADHPAIIDLDNLDQAAFDATGYKFVDSDSFTEFGGDISAAGDINNDGIDDFIIGAAQSDPGGNSSAGQAYVVYGGVAALEAADNADGANDNIINVDNLAVDVDTGILPIEVSVRNAGFFSRFLSEGDAGATVFEFEVQRTGDLTETVGFDFAVAGFGGNPANASDFVGGALPSGTVVFEAGEAVATVAVEVQGDLDIESTEDFSFTISNATTDGPSPISITADETFGRIFNDDFPVQFRANNASVTEGDPGDDRVLVMSVSRFGEIDIEATVDFAIASSSFNPANASDFELASLPSGTLTFAAGETFKTVELRIDEDVNIEPNESVVLTISNAQAATATQILDSTGIGTILNDDFPPRIQVAGNVTVFEGNSGFTPMDFVIERLGDTTGTTTVTYALNPIPAPGDFFAADSNDIDGFLPSFGNTVTFADGESAKVVTVNVNGDGVIEPRETFELRITQVQSDNGTTYDIFRPAGRGTILNDDGRPPNIPPGVEADVFGDPHIVTLDGLGYDFQTVGEYILVETLPGAVNPFQVQVRFEPVPGSDLASVTTRMAVEIDGVVVEIDALGSDPLLIDGAAPSAGDLLLGAIDVNGDGTPDVFFDAALEEFTIVLNGENEQLKLKNADGVLNVCVFLADSADGNQGNVRGLMGDADGEDAAGGRDITDDLALRDGTVLPQPLDFDTLYGAFADSWRLDGSAPDLTPLFSNTVTFRDGFPVAVLTVDDLPADVRELAEAAAIAAGLDPSEAEIFESAVLDFALTGDDSFFEGALGLAADPQASTEPANAPPLPEIVGVAPTLTEIAEGDAGSQSVLFTFYRIGDEDLGDLTVDYAVGGDVNGDDLSETTVLSGSVAFEAGETTKSIAIDVLGDLTTEGDEALTVTITGTDSDSAKVGAVSASTVILTDDFAPEAADDEFTGAANEQIVGDLLAANPDVADDDADGDGLTVTDIVLNGGATVRSANGGLNILEAGATLRVNPDGTFTFNPFGIVAGFNGEAPTDFDALGDGEILSESFIYTVTDGNGGFDSAEVTINVTGVNDAPVTVVDAINLTEDDVSGTVNVIAGSIGPDFDPEGGELKVTKVNGLDVDEVDGLTINLAGGGSLTINQAGDAEFFTEGAFEDLGSALPQIVQKNVNFTYTVEDPQGLASNALLQVFIEGVNDAPEFLADAFNNDEGEIVVAPIPVADAEGDDILFGLDLSEGDTALFDIDAESGLLRFLAAPDFEAPEDADGDNVYEVHVTADDGQATTTQTVLVTVGDVNEAPEIFSSDAFDIDENETFVGTVEAKDPDVDDLLEFSIVRVGAPAVGDGDLFEIDAATGELSFIAAPDFENPADGDGDNVYEVTVAVTDGEETDVQEVLVTVNDVDENEVNLIEGTGGNDRLIGTEGDDLFVSAGGALDLLVATSGGADTFQFGGETANGVFERDIIYGFGPDDLLDLGGATIAQEINGPSTILRLDGDGDLIYLIGVSDFDEANQLAPVGVL